MIIQKFGGTSIGSTDRMRKLAEIIESREQTIVVLSAMSGTTNTLVEIAQLCEKRELHLALIIAENLRSKYFIVATDLFNREENKEYAFHFINEIFDQLTREISLVSIGDKNILSVGEILSTRLFYMYLEELGLNTAHLSALDFMRVNEDGEPDLEFLENKLSVELENHPQANIFVTQGFICKNDKGEVDNLGRGGSDYSATLIAAAIGAKEVQIWTDVDGLQSNDPRFVENTRPVRKISFDEAAELAYFGAKILHPQSVLPAKNAKIPVLLKNTLDPTDEGTCISDTIDGIGFKAVAAKDKITAIKIKSGRMLMAYGFIRKVFEVFERYKTPVDMITTSEVAVSVTIDCIDALDNIVSELENYGCVTVESHQSIIAVVGELVGHHKGYANQLFEALKDVPVRMISYGASKHNISILVSENDKVKTLQALQHGILNHKNLSYAD